MERREASVRNAVSHEALRVIGTSVPVHDAKAKALGTLEYIDDMERPGMLHMKLLLSDHAHAFIEEIDTTAAEQAPGVHAVFCWKNTPQQQYNSAKRFDGQEIIEDEQVFSRTVRFIGDRVAAVAADTVEQAERAVRMITVHYRDLPAQTTFADDDGPLVHPELGTNHIADVIVGYGEVEDAFSEAERVFTHTTSTPAIHHLALEPHGAIAETDSSGKITVWSTTQTTFAVRMLLSDLFGRPRHEIRVIKPPLGGAFGSKIPMILEPIVVCGALATGRPVKLVLTRKETFIATRTRHASAVTVRTAVDTDGNILAQDIRMLLNAGAYATQSHNVAAATAHKIVNLYRFPNYRIHITPLYTNMPVAGAMRGYGSPQLNFALETNMTNIARAYGIDPVAYQLKHLVTPESVHPVYGHSFGRPQPIVCVKRGAELFDWEDRLRRCSSPVDGNLRGVGMSVGIYGNGVFPAHVDYTGIRITVNEDGSVLFFTGTHDMGNGSVTVQKMIIAEELRVPISSIRAVDSDTELCPWNLGDYASRGVFVSGEAARKAAVSMRERILTEAAELLGLDADRLELSEDAVYAREDGTAMLSRSELMRQIHLKRQTWLSLTESHANEAERCSYGAHFAEVLVDPKSGRISLTDYAAVHDVGKVINRLGIEGQLEGGIHMSAGYALSEQLVFDEGGALKNGHLKRYHMVSPAQMPASISLDFIEGVEYPGPYGGKSIGECATVPGAGAIINAVNDALGSDFTSLPVTADDVLGFLAEQTTCERNNQ